MAARCRASSRAASSAVAGQIGLKLYHWAGAGAMWRSSALATFCVAMARSDGELDGTRIGSSAEARKVPPGWRLIENGMMVEPCLAASRAGPAGIVVHYPNIWTGMPSSR
jgi:hypothetical protein